MSRVLVDSSVWIDMFRKGPPSPEAAALHQLLENGLACVNGLIRAEILSGARSQADYRFLQEGLSAVEELADPEDLWDQVAVARYRLARRGFQAGVADLIIAVDACHHHKVLFTRDHAFRRMQEALPLRLFQNA